MAKKLQDNFYVPGRMAIVYRNPDSELYNVRFEPNDPRLPEEGLQFPHLTNPELNLLIVKGYLILAPKKKVEEKAE